jgi:hypothetical protein
VRYFDLRIAALGDKFHIWHGLCGEEAANVFHEMAQYAKQFPTEILILDLVPHHFSDFNESLHERFSELVFGTFGSMLSPYAKLNPSSTIGHFWESQTNVIVIYSPPNPNPRHADYWWPSNQLHSHWPKHCKNADQWFKWACTHLSERREDTPLWVLQGVITPDAGIIAKFNGVNSVQDLSRVLNPRAVHFLTKSVNHDHNIIMLDFFDNCSLIPAIQWANVGGQRIFPDSHLFAGVGHHCHFQTISVVQDASKGEVATVGIAFNTKRDWHSAVMRPNSNPLPWTQSSQLRGIFVQDAMFHTTMRLFHLENSPYAVMATPLGAKILRFDWATGAWSLFSEVHAFGASDGFGTPSPTHRGTFAALSPLTSGVPAFLTGFTISGLTVAVVTPSTFHPNIYRWEPPVEMLEPYFTSYATPETRAFLAQKKLDFQSPAPSNSDDFRASLAHSSLHVSLRQKPGVHTAYTQVCPFVLFGRLYLFVQGSVDVLFQKPPVLYESEAISFICTCENGSFAPLALDNVPPPIHRGTRSSFNHTTPDHLILGSPWHVEVINDVAYFLCRTSEGIRTWKFDGTSISELPLYKAFLDTFHWHEPLYGCSLRTFVLNERLFFMGRSSAGLVLISLQNDAWVPAPGFAEFSDFSGWHLEEYAKSIQVNVMGPIAYVTGRCVFGLITVRFDGAEWTHFDRPILKPPIII